MFENDDTQLILLPGLRPHLHVVPDRPLSRADVIDEDMPAWALGLALAACAAVAAVSLLAGVAAAVAFGVLAWPRRTVQP